MTAGEVIKTVDALKPNGYTREDKLRWLRVCDGTIYNEIFLTHEGMEGEAPGEMTEETPLLAAAPYDELYIWWLEAMIDQANGETARYANSVTMYNNALLTYQAWCNRTYMPVQKVKAIKC